MAGFIKTLKTLKIDVKGLLLKGLMPTEYVKPLDMIRGQKYILEPYDTSGRTIAYLTGYNRMIKILMSSSHTLNDKVLSSSGDIHLSFEVDRWDNTIHLNVNTYALPNGLDQLFIKQLSIQEVYDNKIKDYEVREAYERMTMEDGQRGNSPAYLISEYAGFAPINRILTMPRLPRLPLSHR